MELPTPVLPGSGKRVFLSAFMLRAPLFHPYTNLTTKWNLGGEAGFVAPQNEVSRYKSGIGREFLCQDAGCCLG